MKLTNCISRHLVKSVINAEVNRFPRSCIGVIYQPARPKTSSVKNV